LKWEKLGLVWGPDGKQAWARNSVLQPTVLVLNERVMRVYGGFRDDGGISRVGFVDVAAGDPTRVLAVSEQPALDIGIAGTFDENGVVPTCAVRRDGRIYLYYAGYQLGRQVRFYVFAGLAVSDDGGSHFERVHQVPVADRTDEELYFRVIHCLLEEQGTWRAWYGGGSSFVPHEGRTLPVYDVRYMESSDGFTFPASGEVAIPLRDENEHRVGRPWVVKRNDSYVMFYGAATKRDNYRLGYAESADGRHWTRCDENVGISTTPGAWDSDMLAYPCVVEHQGNVFMFYNGNAYGAGGFGCAILRQW
jgi:hypothetical protein